MHARYNPQAFVLFIRHKQSDVDFVVHFCCERRALVADEPGLCHPKLACTLARLSTLAKAA